LKLIEMDSTGKCYLLCMPAEILAMFFKYFNFEREKNAFIKFWIACLGYGEIKLQLRSALLKIDVPAALEKSKSTLLSQYLTSYKWSRHVKCLNFFTQIQQSYPRLKNVKCPATFENFLTIENFIAEVKKLPKIEEINLNNNAIKISDLKEFPKLCRIKKCYSIENDLKSDSDIVLPNVTFFSATDIFPFTKFFPNIVHLKLLLEDNEEYTGINLSSLIFLQKLEIYTHDSGIDIFVDGLELIYAKFKQMDKLISQCGTFPKLIKLESDDNHTDDFDEQTFRSEDLFDKTPNLKIFVGKQMSSLTIPSLANFTQLTHLTLERCYFWAYKSDLDLEPLLDLVNLTSLELIFLELGAKGQYEPHVLVLNTICKRLSKLKWVDVSLYGEELEDIYIAPNASSIQNLQSLCANLRSADWVDLIPTLITIPRLDLIYYKAKNDGNDLSTFGDPIDFFTTLHTEGLKLAASFLLKTIPNGRICQTLNIGGLSRIQEKQVDNIISNVRLS
jgi:hypothetical protein